MHVFCSLFFLMISASSWKKRIQMTSRISMGKKKRANHVIFETRSKALFLTLCLLCQLRYFSISIKKGECWCWITQNISDNAGPGGGGVVAILLLQQYVLRQLFCGLALILPWWKLLNCDSPVVNGNSGARGTAKKTGSERNRTSVFQPPAPS